MMDDVTLLIIFLLGFVGGSFLRVAVDARTSFGEWDYHALTLGWVFIIMSVLVGLFGG